MWVQPRIVTVSGGRKSSVRSKGKSMRYGMPPFPLLWTLLQYRIALLPGSAPATSPPVPLSQALQKEGESRVEAAGLRQFSTTTTEV